MLIFPPRIIRRNIFRIIEVYMECSILGVINIMRINMRLRTDLLQRVSVIL